MPVFRNAASIGVFRPEDLIFLHSVFEDSRDVDDSEELARTLLRLYQAGMRDRELLLATVSKAKAKKPGPL